MADSNPSLLTETQREYLRGEQDLSGNNERVRRSRIRDRVVQGIADFDTLWRGIKTTDHLQIFEFDHLHGQADTKKAEQLFHDGLVAMLAFVYSGLKNQGYGPDHIEDLLERAISDAEGMYAEYPDAEIRMATVDVEINIDQYTGGKELEKLLFQGLASEGIIDEGDQVDDIHDILLEKGLLHQSDKGNKN